MVWYHRNERSIWAANLKHQGLESFQAKGVDPLLGRTFGGCLLGEGLVSENATTLRSAGRRKRFSLRVYPLTAMAAEPSEWLARLDQNIQTVGAVAAEKAVAEHRAWWADFWNRSWVRISGTKEAETVTRSYALQRWVSACAGRGAYAIKFNGSIFTVDAHTAGPGLARLGRRLLVAEHPAAVLADAGIGGLRPHAAAVPDVFRTPSNWPPSETASGSTARRPARDHELLGTDDNGDYGWNREGKPVSDMVNHYIRWITASTELMR